MALLLRLDLGDRWSAPPADQADLVRYLGSGIVLRRIRSHTIDEVVPVRGRVVPGSILTDGTWVWSAGHAHYVGTYAVRCRDDFRDHARRLRYAVPEVDAVRLRELTMELARWGL